MTQIKIHIDPEQLISLIESKPAIWDNTLDIYKDKSLRTLAWREICNVLTEEFEDMEEIEKQNMTKLVIRKWNQIRDSFTRSLLNKRKKGSAVKKYCYHNQLLFLKKVLDSDKYESLNYSQDTSTVETSQDSTDNEEREIHISIKHEKSEPDPIYEHFEPSFVVGTPKQENLTGAKRFKRNDVEAAEERLNAIEQKMLLMNYQINQHNSQNEDRNMSFFKSLLPTLNLLNDDQTLQFQAGVISLLQNIRSPNHNELCSQQPSTSNNLD